MSKTQKELAFLRDLYISELWTARFTENFDKNFEFSNEENILYLNAGNGNHVLALHEKLGEDIEILGICENEDLKTIAEAKAKAIKAKVNFSTRLPDKQFDLVIANASFVRPNDLEEFLERLIDVSDYKAAVYLPTAGSFGEIFSVLWETLLNSDLVDKCPNIECLIDELPKVSDVEEMAEELGLSFLKTKTKNEIFEFANGAEFMESTLISDFLLPVWLDFLDDKEKEQVNEKLAQMIDDSSDGLTFRFSVKATLIKGEID